MTNFPTTGRYIFFLSAFILILQVAVATGQNTKGGVIVSYEQSGTSRIARFKNSNSYPVRVEFSYQGTRSRGSGEASGEDAVFVAAQFFRHLRCGRAFHHVGSNHRRNEIGLAEPVATG